MSDRALASAATLAVDAAPYEWALALAGVTPRAGAVHDKAHGAAQSQALAKALREYGYGHTAAAVLEQTSLGGRTSVANPNSSADVDDALALADAALADVVRSRRQPIIPSVNTTETGLPRFAIAGPDLTALTQLLHVEFGPNGVDAELRLFLDEALAQGDLFVDAAPAAGCAALTADTFREPISVVALHTDEVERSALEQSALGTAALHGRTTRLQAFAMQPLDALPLPDLPSRAYVLLHCGSAAQVVAQLAGARQLQRDGRLGVVAWSRTSRDAVDIALTVLDVLGFQHFALADGADGVELVPADALGTSTMVFSLSPEFMQRADQGAERRAHANDADSATDAVECASRALFEAIEDNLAPGSRELGRIPAPGELALAQLSASWDAARIVSFDIFDTLVVRQVAVPTDLFLHLAHHAPFDALARSARDIADAREHAEELARRAGYDRHGSTEVTLEAIHTVLAELLGLTSTVVPAMVAAERYIEQALCEAHPALASWFARAQREGKIVWCISDTYHNSDFLTELLRACGYDMTGVRVFSSAQMRSSKGDGTLFQRLLAKVPVVAADVLHIGDHPVGDGTMPQAYGLVAVVHPWGAARHSDTPCSAPGDALALGVAMIGARCHEPAPPFWWRFGYSVAGPVLAGFALWLRSRFAQDGIDRAYFLLRDGEILESVYRIMSGDDAPDGTPSTALLESSRRAFVLPAYEAGKPTLWSQLTATENARPAREFLERMAIDAARHGAAFRAAGFVSPDDVVDPRDRASLGRVATLLRQPAVDAALRARAGEERALLLAYLEQEGVVSGGRVALVDVGWNGTIQKSLAAILDLEHRQQSIAGYYLGTLPPAHVDIGDSRVAGYLFEAGRPSARARAVLQLPQLLEFVCSTTRGSLRGFERHDGRVRPVHGAVDHNAAQQAMHDAMRTGVLAYARRVAAACSSHGVTSIGPDTTLRRLARVVERPTAEEARHIGALQHAEGMSADRARTLATFAPTSGSIDRVLADRAAAYWPAGLAAQRLPQALVLRAAQWLAESESE